MDKGGNRIECYIDEGQMTVPFLTNSRKQQFSNGK